MRETNFPVAAVGCVEHFFHVVIEPGVRLLASILSLLAPSIRHRKRGQIESGGTAALEKCLLAPVPSIKEEEEPNCSTNSKGDDFDLLIDRRVAGGTTKPQNYRYPPPTPELTNRENEITVHLERDDDRILLLFHSRDCTVGYVFRSDRPSFCVYACPSQIFTLCGTQCRPACVCVRRGWWPRRQK